VNEDEDEENAASGNSVCYMMSIDRLGSAGEGVWEKLVKSIEKVWLD